MGNNYATEYEERIAGYPKECPITGRPFFAELELDGLLVPTYGGPYDSYTIPVKDSDEEGEWYIVHRFDHDGGYWHEPDSVDLNTTEES